MRKKSTISSDGEPLFTKEQFLRAKQFEHQSDVVQAILEDGALYSRGQAEDLIQKFYAREVES